MTVRAVRRSDLDQVIALDAQETGLEKRDYWERVYKRYGRAVRGEQSWFLVAVTGSEIVGFVIGEVRDWEFGSPPCGWLFAINISQEARLAGIGSRLMTAFCEALRAAGVRKLRTMLSRDNTLVLSFFRSQGMMAAPIIPLELELPAAAKARA
ncbi:MAG TPA: GNAT family N-acetyltransferase [Ramlibacter sp.]|uniref:GNAT family N-acetyltransferase n=1 Tax=Ramlibacter sp. TaxID=1917967 RepID=UPI002D81086A|nr:GNAT family N-acetyltransferase [Ramlibacter sp.]HET8744353.1 GNAT family N-acetyltransferase [Ramlibacter sp.]